MVQGKPRHPELGRNIAELLGADRDLEAQLVGLGEYALDLERRLAKLEARPCRCDRPAEAPKPKPAEVPARAWRRYPDGFALYGYDDGPVFRYTHYAYLDGPVIAYRPPAAPAQAAPCWSCRWQ